MQTTRTQVELLAPAGEWQSLLAAVANGADAVYFGLDDFNARRRAENFTLEELPKVVGFLHDHNVKAYVAMNTLIFPPELTSVAEYAAAVAASGADAVIVQDLGLATMLAELAPTLAVHASTQMSLSEQTGIAFAAGLGVRRVILPRELSADQVASLTEMGTGSLSQSHRERGACTHFPRDLEVFVHGALCVSFSGQCLASQSLWARSSNRGQCGQACRLPYKLVVDGKDVDQAKRRYLLSPRDLNTANRMGDIIRAGVAAVKIEGRLKGPHYVAAVVAAYREAIDSAAAGRPFELSERHLARLAQGFSRGSTEGFIGGADAGTIIDGRSPKSRMLRVGVVAARTSHGVVVEMDVRGGQPPVKNGDGVVFDDGRREDNEIGGRVYSAQIVAGGNLAVGLGRDVPLADITIGSIVWKTDDPAIRKELENTWSRDVVSRPAEVALRATLLGADELLLGLRDGAGHQVENRLAGLATAMNRPLTADLLAEQFSRLGGTPFKLGAVELLSGESPASELPVMVPKSMLNQARRELAAGLVEMRRAAAVHVIADADAISHLRAKLEQSTSLPETASATQPATLHVLVRRLEQLQALLDWPGRDTAVIGSVFAELARLEDMREAMATGRRGGLAMGVAGPRVILPGEQALLDTLAELLPAAVLARNLPTLLRFAGNAGVDVIADSSLNTANDLTAGVLVRAGAARVTPAYELDCANIKAMIEHLPAGRMECVAYGHVPMFYTAHDIGGGIGDKGIGDWNPQLGTGSLFSRPFARKGACTQFPALRDRNGVAHPMEIDSTGRTTVFRGDTESFNTDMPKLLARGVRNWRVELLDESAEQTRKLLGQVTTALAQVGV